MPRLPAYTTATKSIPHKLPTMPWEIVGADIFSVDNETLLHIVDCYSKFPVMKRADGLSADILITTTKVMLAELGLPRKTVSDAGMNFCVRPI